ncbi:MAG TPA: metalloregulator ArsR/SmtB family transcription factor [Vicinamibacterales bacterium]|jgi:ArsR family transcriptional regulator
MSTASKARLTGVPPIEDHDNCDATHLDPNSWAAIRQRLLPARTVEGLADTFRALGDPTRVRILDALSTGELCVCDIASLVGISESAVSHQLRLLRGMRLVRPRRAGRLVYYAVDDHHILELLRQAMTHVEELSAVSPELSAASSQLPASSSQLPASSSQLPAGADRGPRGAGR